MLLIEILQLKMLTLYFPVYFYLKTKVTKHLVTKLPTSMSCLTYIITQTLLIVLQHDENVVFLILLPAFTQATFTVLFQMARGKAL